jgi:adenylate kinase family enzyme
LTLRLKEKLRLPVYHTDQFSWKDGWDKAQSNDAILHYVEGILKQDQWILEGYLGYTTLPDTRLRAATTVIFLDYSRPQLAWHLLKRQWIHHGKKRPEMPDICRESFGWHTISWAFEYYSKKDWRANVDNWVTCVPNDRLLVFKTPKQLELWLTSQRLG